jgi:hypothetical protein
MVMPLTLKAATFRLETELLAALSEIRERDGIGVSEQVRRALKAWIEAKGVKVKAPARRVVARRAR